MRNKQKVQNPIRVIRVFIGVLGSLILAAGVLGFGGGARAQMILGISQSSINSGDSVMISGSGFGIKSTPAPLVLVKK